MIALSITIKAALAQAKKAPTIFTPSPLQRVGVRINEMNYFIFAFGITYVKLLFQQK